MLIIIFFIFIKIENYEHNVYDFKVIALLKILRFEQFQSISKNKFLKIV